MESDPHLFRFISYLSLFTFFMLILVTANNFLQLFVGWEGVGLSSYLLINFWFTRIQANKAAIKAMLVNRVGDFFIIFAFCFIAYVFNSLDYDIVFSLSPLVKDIKCFYNLTYIDIITILLFLGAMGKSAQLGLHTWLPDAMEGPTPVSALIHAATMVTAGIFLIARCSFLFELSSISLNLILIVGALTCFFGSSVGLFQNDIKKVIAYSTCSQLGYMIFSCGLSAYDVAMFHLSNHAFFKALLFLTAGAIIHALNDEQDIRKYGGLATKLPFSFSVFVLGSLSLMGLPFFSGFYSKDVILELAYSKGTVYSFFAYFLGTLSVFSTSFYSSRLLCLIFLVEPNSNRQTTFSSHEPGIKMGLPLFILSILSIFVGYLTSDLFIGIGNNFWGDSIFILPKDYLIVDIEFIPVYIKLIPLLFFFLGTITAFLIYSNYLDLFFKLKKNKIFLTIYNFLLKKWYFDRFYNEFITNTIINLGFNFFYTEIERGFLEHFGPFGIINLFRKATFKLNQIEKGSFFFLLSVLYFFISLCLLFFFFFLYFIDSIEIFIFCTFFLIFSYKDLA